jgi:hypothetical protein
MVNGDDHFCDLYLVRSAIHPFLTLIEATYIPTIACPLRCEVFPDANHHPAWKQLCWSRFAHGQKSPWTSTFSIDRHFVLVLKVGSAFGFCWTVILSSYTSYSICLSKTGASLSILGGNYFAKFGFRFKTYNHGKNYQTRANTTQIGFVIIALFQIIDHIECWDRSRIELLKRRSPNEKWYLGNNIYLRVMSRFLKFWT